MDRKKTQGKERRTPIQDSHEYGRVQQVQEHNHHDNEDAREGGDRLEMENAPPGILTIHLDDIPYHITQSQFTAADLRYLSVPPIGEDKDLYRVASDGGENIRLNDSDIIQIDLRDADGGRHFISVHKTDKTDHGSHIEPTKEELAKRAYFLYLNSGCKKGHDLEYWLEAEKQIRQNVG